MHLVHPNYGLTLAVYSTTVYALCHCVRVCTHRCHMVLLQVTQWLKAYGNLIAVSTPYPQSTRGFNHYYTIHVQAIRDKRTLPRSHPCLRIYHNSTEFAAFFRFLHRYLRVLGKLVQWKLSIYECMCL